MSTILAGPHIDALKLGQEHVTYKEQTYSLQLFDYIVICFVLKHGTIEFVGTCATRTSLIQRVFHYPPSSNRY